MVQPISIIVSDDGLSGWHPLAVVTANGAGGPATLLWLYSNHLGTPVRASTATGAAAPLTGFTLPGFPGQHQTLPDLYYNQHRDYDPTTGRYIQADPIGLAGDANPYLYAGASPMRFVDPQGLQNRATPRPRPRPTVAGRGPLDPFVFPRLQSQLDQFQRDRAAGRRPRTGGYHYESLLLAVGLRANVRGQCYDLGGVYVLVNARGEILYTGRTIDFSRRQAEHLRRHPGLSLRPVLPTSNYSLMRGLEAAIHSATRPPLNRIRPVSP